MTHKQFDEDQLEQVLNNAPKLSDHRSKDEVLQRLLADARLQDNSHLQAAVQELNESQLTTHEVNEKQDFIQAENKDLPITKRKYKKNAPIYECCCCFCADFNSRFHVC